MKILTREALFVNEFVQIKYKDVYREAANFYNEINMKHSQKPDLRKTTEFRQWKNNMAIVNGDPTAPIPRQKGYKYNRTEYRDIKLSATTETQQENHHLDERLAGMTMCLNIPLMSMPQPNVSEEEGDQTTDQMSTVIEEGDDQTMDPSTLDQMSTVIEEGDDQTMDPSTLDQMSTVIEEGDDQPMDPSILDQIAPDIVEKIISELRLDPNLKDMMDEIDQQVNTEEELVGLEIDLPELDDLLEEELQSW